MRTEDVKGGVCFLYKARFSPVEHLHIILAVDCEGWPSDECVMVNLTDSSGGTDSMTFKIGDHPYITKPSDVNFGDCEVTTRATIARYASVAQQPDFDPAKLREIGLRAKVHPAVWNESRRR